MKVLDKIKKPLIFVLLAGMVVGYYIYLSNRNTDSTETPVETSVASEVLDRDLERNYPATPKSVVSYFCEIQKIIYKEELTDQEFEEIVTCMRSLYDDELLAYNDRENYAFDLKAEIESYQAASKYIAEYIVEDGYGIEFLSYSGDSYAKVDVKYILRVGKSVVTLYEEYTLRKDEESRWKILYWEETDASVME